MVLRLTFGTAWSLDGGNWVRQPGMATTRERRKLRRQFRRKGYRAVYHEVNGYPPGKRELAHEWLREREIASDRRKHWMIFALIVVGIAAVFAAYLAAVQLRWL
jgi:hypothetical protein